MKKNKFQYTYPKTKKGLLTMSELLEKIRFAMKNKEYYRADDLISDIYVGHYANSKSFSAIPSKIYKELFYYHAIINYSNKHYKVAASYFIKSWTIGYKMISNCAVSVECIDNKEFLQSAIEHLKDYETTVADFQSNFKAINEFLETLETFYTFAARQEERMTKLWN